MKQCRVLPQACRGLPARFARGLRLPGTACWLSGSALGNFGASTGSAAGALGAGAAGFVPSGVLGRAFAGAGALKFPLRFARALLRGWNRFRFVSSCHKSFIFRRTLSPVPVQRPRPGCSAYGPVFSRRLCARLFVFCERCAGANFFASHRRSSRQVVSCKCKTPSKARAASRKSGAG